MDAPADIHLETDIFADKDNAQGLQPGTWIPYLSITYQVVKKGSDWSTFGRYIPMVASDGMHYGNNVTLTAGHRITVKVTLNGQTAVFHATVPRSG